MSFTPGPWSIETRPEDGVSVIIGKQHALAAVVPIEGWPELEGANARLMAAAPEMYALLEQARDQLDYLGKIVHEEDTPIVIEDIDALLARIREEKP